ncbi:sigma-70 family RNA polymerase sigma factor [Luteimonas sp. TWI1437]|uniref:RNA polymerase sigma factor n=1 Tax=unclassified Luteimonas TaxID=2629088 RepID=UPI003209110B
MSRRDQNLAANELASVDEVEPLRSQFDAAMALHRDELFNYLKRRTRDVETAADLAQETLSRMMVYRDASNIESYELLMYRVAHNLVLEHQRARHRHRASDHVSLSVVGPIRAEEATVEDIADAQLTLKLLKRALIDLPPKCRMAFMLSRFEGLTYPQVASKMGISVKTVEKHISKALLAFRAAVGDPDE